MPCATAASSSRPLHPHCKEDIRMPAELNFFDTYTMMDLQNRIEPKQTFISDRYIHK